MRRAEIQTNWASEQDFAQTGVTLLQFFGAQQQMTKFKQLNLGQVTIRKKIGKFGRGVAPPEKSIFLS